VRRRRDSSVLLVPEREGDDQEIEISQAAIRAYGRLRRLFGSGVRIHAVRDGGLICEYARIRSHPRLWRVSRDGAIVPDRPYSYARRTFVPADLPKEIG
jgi:hypothetical protein